MIFVVGKPRSKRSRSGNKRYRGPIMRIDHSFAALDNVQRELHIPGRSQPKTTTTDVL